MEAEFEEAALPPNPLGMTVSEVAQRLRCSDAQVRKLIVQGRLKAEKLGKSYYVSSEALSSIGKAPPVRPAPFPFRQASSQDFDRYEDPFAALRALPEDHILTVYRLSQGKKYWVCDMSPEEFSQRLISQSFGGGTFEATATVAGEVVQRKTFQIDGPAKHPDQKQVSHTESDRPIERSQESMVRLVEAVVAKVMAQNQTPSIPSPAPSREQFLQEMLLMRQVFASPPPPPPTANIDVVSNALLKGVEMAITLGNLGSGANEGIGTKLLNGLIPTLSSIVGGIAQKTLGTTPENTSALSTKNPSEISTSNSTSSEQDQLKAMITLVRAGAAENRDPHAYAELLFENLPDQAIEQIPQASEADFLQFATGLDPALASYPQWVKGLQENLVDMIQGDEEEVVE